VPRYTFPGFGEFLHAAAEELGVPEAEAPAGRITALTALANLCAQAGAADPGHAPGIMAKAAGFRDQLGVAHRAAELMLAEVNHALGVHGSAGPPGRPPGPARPSRAKGRADG
jgi:hypothetical protein